MNAGYDVTTSAQLVKALVANGPKHNVIRGLAPLNEKWHIAALKQHLGAMKVAKIRSIREVDYSAAGGIVCHTHSLAAAPRVIDWRALSEAQGCTRVGWPSSDAGAPARATVDEQTPAETRQWIVL